MVGACVLPAAGAARFWRCRFHASPNIHVQQAWWGFSEVCSPLLPHEIPKPYPHLPCLNHWLQSAPVCQSVPVAACFSMPGCVTGCLAASAFALHCFWLPQLLFLLSEVVPPQLCAAATTHPASLQLHSLLCCAAVHPVRCGYCVRCVPC